MSTRVTSPIKDQNAAKNMSYIYDKFVGVHAERVPFNIVFVSKSHYIYSALLNT